MPINGNTLTVYWDKNPDVDLLGYNIFQNGSWIGTVTENDTSFRINVSKLPAPVNNRRVISIEAFDYDGETSQIRSSVQL